MSDFTSLYRDNILFVADSKLSPIPHDVTSKYMQTDYWNVMEDEQPASELIQFIKAGPPPVFFGFGSMSDRNGQRTVEMIERITGELNLRAIIQKGWAGLGENIANKNVLVVDTVPHHLIFPHMSLVVHHGGAGTTHPAALAGVPQIVIAQHGDQYYWGARVQTLNLGATIKKAQLSTSNLRKAIIYCHDSQIQNRAKKMAEELKNREDMDSIARRIMHELSRSIA